MLFVLVKNGVLPPSSGDEIQCKFGYIFISLEFTDHFPRRMFFLFFLNKWLSKTPCVILIVSSSLVLPSVEL